MTLIFKSISINFLGGLWTGALVVATTPFYVSTLGLEGFGLVGFWQLLLFVSAIFDFGLGASLVREFARYEGSKEPARRYWELLKSLQTAYLCAAIVIGGAIWFAADWLATRWLKLVVIYPDDASILIKLMAASIALQFMTTLYSSGLSGMQRHATMNGFMMLGNTLKYLGGAAILLIEGGLLAFFSYQVIAAFVVCWLTRRKLIGQMGWAAMDRQPSFDFGHLRHLSRYSLGMFLTALSGLLLANLDRLALSKLVSADEFGKYSLAYTAAGMLQMIILAFYRSYFPRFSELKASGDESGLKHAYYQGCGLVGAVIVPTAVAACVFAPELFRVWIGNHDENVVASFRLLIVGATCSGLMWLPAALQQAVGWTRLHVALMVLALSIGGPCLVLGIKSYGTVGATVMMLVHGAIEITLGLWLMNRVLFPGENAHWYVKVLIAPLFASIPVALVSIALMPIDMSRPVSLGWLAITGIIMLLSAIAIDRRLLINK